MIGLLSLHRKTKGANLSRTAYYHRIQSLKILKQSFAKMNFQTPMLLSAGCAALSLSATADSSKSSTVATEMLKGRLFRDCVSLLPLQQLGTQSIPLGNPPLFSLLALHLNRQLSSMAPDSIFRAPHCLTSLRKTTTDIPETSQ